MPAKSKKSSTLNGTSNYKGISALSYIVFFLPLLFAKESKFAMYHANQGLLLFIFALGVNLIGAVIPFLGWFLVLPIGSIVIIVLAVMGIINALNGQMKPLPVIGNYTLLS